MIHSDENIRKIITNYIKIFRKNFTADSFYSGMENNSYLKDMLRNPYQIRKIISFAGDSAAVQPVAVYDRLIRDIVEDKWGDLFVGLDSSAVINVLRVLACTGLGNDGIVIPARRIAETLEECASQAGVYAPVDWTGFADSIAIRSGLLLYDDMKNGFTFMSDNFMYYLAAQWIYLLYTNRYATIDSRLDGTDVPVNSYMLKGILSDCLKKYKTDLKTVTMLFFIADYKEKTTRNSGTDTVQLLMELMVENALLYGDDELKAQLSDLLTKAIPASDMGKLRLKGKKNYHLTEKL